MPKSSKNYRLHSSRSEHKPSSRKISLDTFLSKQLLPAISPVRIVHEKGSVRIWTLDSSGRLLMRLIDTDLEVLAFTFLANHSFIRGSLKLSVTSKRGIHVTLSCSPPTAPFSMSASMTLYRQELTKHIGHGGARQDLESPPY